MNKDSRKKTDSKHKESQITVMDAEAMSEACRLLENARVRKCDLLSNGSNYVFLARMESEGMEVKAIYKPRQGEAPLWDFPDGTLYKREYAAYIVSQTLEWGLIPPTVIRDGPYGIGSMQWFVESKNAAGPYPEIKYVPILKQAALFDYLVNNADRKAGHFLQGKDRRLWLVDHGLTFNVEPKLRTVLWDFAGETVPDELVADVKRLRDKLKTDKALRDSLCSLLDEAEVETLEVRIKTIMDKPEFVQPGLRRNVPWPWY